MNSAAAVLELPVADSPEPEPRCVDAPRVCPHSKATVTAVIPTFGRPELVCTAIQSALAQTHRNLEVIVVVDGPDRRTLREIESLRQPRVRVIELAAKVGGAEARNLGVRAASSEWIAFLDDDDEWLPGKIAAQLAAARLARAPQPVLSSQVIVRTEACDWISPQCPYNPAEPVSEFLFCRTRFLDSARYMQTSTLLMKRALMRELPFRPGLKRHQDWDWLLRASARSDVGFHMVPQPLAVFHAHAGKPSLSHALDWQFSADWAREMRPAFTARAYAFFLANECLSRAVKARAGGAVYARLIGESFAHGRPAPRSLLSMAGFLCLSEPMRHRLRQRARGARTHPHPAPSWPASLGV